MPILQGRAGLVTLLDVPLGLSAGTITNSLGMKFAPIKAGEFLMGSPRPDNDAFDRSRKPQQQSADHSAVLPRVCIEVTRGQFRRFVDDSGYQTEAEKDGKGGYGTGTRPPRSSSRTLATPGANPGSSRRTSTRWST